MIFSLMLFFFISFDFFLSGLNQLKALTSDLTTDISSLALLSRVNIAAKNKGNYQNLSNFRPSWKILKSKISPLRITVSWYW